MKANHYPSKVITFFYFRREKLQNKITIFNKIKLQTRRKA